MKKLRYLASTAALALGAAGLLVPATASAATITPGGAVAVTPAPTSASGSGAVTGTIPGTSVLCTSHWNWHVSHPATGGYSEVEWTSNPCGFRIEDRNWCVSVIPPDLGHYNYSGIVKRTYLWDKAGCGVTEVITGAQQRYESGSSWHSWKQYWSR